MTATYITEKSKVSIKNQTLAAMVAMVAAVALPQLFHRIGALTGLGTVFGEMILPMHLPVILVGLLAGPLAGGLAGLMAPMISFLLTGMPLATMLPFMMLELTVYGLTSGVLRRVKLSNVAKVLLVQVTGRALRAVAILVAVYVFGNSFINVAVIWTSISAGIVGIALQLICIPAIVGLVEKYEQ